MEVSQEEANEIAAEVVAAIDWQTSNIIASMDSENVNSEDAIDAMTPKHPATVRLITAMESERYKMKGLVPPDAPFRIVLMATTAGSIAKILVKQGHVVEAQSIVAALERHDQTAQPH